MKKMMVVASFLMLGYCLSWAADEPSSPASSQPSAVTNPGSQGVGGNASTEGVQAAQTPPSDWTNLKGTVQMVNTTAKTVQIKDASGSSLQIPVDRQVKITKDGEKVKLSQLQPGDMIILARRNPSTQDGSKTN